MHCTSENRANRGFTLAELLIVVAIIAVLVSICVPVFSTHLERSREATDLANVRSAYAEVITAALVGDTTDENYLDGTWSITVELEQTQDGWQSSTPIRIGGVTSGDDGGSNAEGTWIGLPKAKGTCVVSCDREEKLIFLWSGEAGGGGSSEGGDSSPTITGTPYPEQGADAEIIKGHVYTYAGKRYVCLSSQAFSQYYYVSPSDENASWMMVEWSDDATVYTSSDLITSAGNQLSNLKRGDIFRYDDGTTYIRAYDASWGQEPLLDTSGSNWVRIEQ